MTRLLDLVIALTLDVGDKGRAEVVDGEDGTEVRVLFGLGGARTEEVKDEVRGDTPRGLNEREEREGGVVALGANEGERGEDHVEHKAKHEDTSNEKTGAVTTHRVDIDSHNPHQREEENKSESNPARGLIRGAGDVHDEVNKDVEGEEHEEGSPSAEGVHPQETREHDGEDDQQEVVTISTKDHRERPELGVDHAELDGEEV